MTDTPERFRVAIIGGGPTGLGAARTLAQLAIGPVVLIERRNELGGVPAGYRVKPGGVPTFIDWTSGRILHGRQFVERLLQRLNGADVDIRLETQVLDIEPGEKRLRLVSPERGTYQITADAIILACGAREQTPAERSWLVGDRPARVLFGKHISEWIDRHGKLPAAHPAIVGSDLIAFSMAAKLRAAGCADADMIDTRPSPETPLPARLYFRRWAKPRFRGGVQAAEIRGSAAVTTLEVRGGASIACDAVTLAGELIPNSELALLGGLEVELPSRQLVLAPGQQLSSPGWFAAGNILGGFRGAQWCYFNGRRVAKRVARYLQRHAT